MFRAVFMIVSYLSLAGGFMAAVVDGSRSLGTGGLYLTYTGDVIQGRFPGLPSLLHKVHPFLWDPLTVQVMRLPLCIFLGGFGLLLVVILGRRSEKVGFARI
jgi:hypothetical protein